VDPYLVEVDKVRQQRTYLPKTVVEDEEDEEISDDDQ
jgi:hypothetical protein